MAKVIAVVGSTGGQGGGLCRAILADPGGGFSCRAITRDPSKDKAKALAAERIRGCAGVKADCDAKLLRGGVNRIVKVIAKVGHLR